ncbi:unnamed protein product [Musa textilis]
MDDSWLAKCVAPPPPLPPLPAPTSTPTVPPQQLPLPPASAGQVSMNLRHHFPSFLAQEALLKDQARSQETSASLGKTELGNSFLALLSGKFAQLPNSRMDIAKPQVSNDDKILSGSGCVVPSINIPPLPENHGDNAPGNWNELSSFVASRPSVNSASLHNSAQVAGNSYHDMDSIELVSQQSSKCNNTGFALNSTRSGWPTSSKSANAKKHATMDIQASRIVSFEAKPPVSNNNSLFLRGHPLVFCRNTVGELFMGNKGLFEVICFCHSCHMSVAKFCEHSGSPSANPGEAVYMENGMSISHWCKQCLGILAPNDISGWEWTGGSSTKGVFFGSKASNAPTLVNNIGTISEIKSFGESWRSAEPLNNSVVPSHPYTIVGYTAQEKSVNKVQDNEYQRYNLDGRNLFQGKIHSSEQVIKPVLSKNQPMQIAKQSPTCVGSEKLHSTLCKGKEIINHHLDTDCVNYNTKFVDQSVALPCLWTNKSVNHDCDISSNNFSIDRSLADKDAASNIELRLGQPSQKCHIFAGSYPTPVLEFGATCNPKKPHFHQQLKQQVDNACDRKKTSQSLHFTASEGLCSNKRLERHATTAVNTYNHSESEDLSRSANKNPLISLFLSHLEGNNTSLSLDNFFNSSDHLPSRVPSGDSPIKLKVSNPVGDATHGIERKSEASKLDFLNILDERKSLLAADNGIVKSVCIMQDNQIANTREIDTSFSKMCPQISVSVDGSQTSFYPDQLSGMLQKLGGKIPKQHDKACVSNKDYCNHAVHGSSDPVLNEMVGHDSLNLDIPMSLASTSLCPLEPKTKVLNTTQHLMDVNLKNFAFRHMVGLTTQKSSTSLKKSPQHHKLCCLSSMEPQLDGCQDLAMQRDTGEGNYCRNSHEISKIAIKSVHSCPSCQSGCGMDIFPGHPCHTGSTRSCNCTGSTQRVPLSSEKYCKRFSTCCICDVDEQPCLRLGRLASNCFTGSLKHGMCNHKEHNSCLSQHCCSSVLPYCVSGFCTSGGNKTFHALSERRVCGQAKVMHATPDHDKDYLIPDRKRICLAHCGCSKNKFVPRNDQKTTFWRDVPKKVYADADISSTDKIAQALETTKRIGDQLDDCSPEFDGTRQSSQSTRAQKMFNMSSGSSAPVVTEVSTEVNNLTSCTANIRTTKMIHDLLVDEGSGNEKCGSSDEAVGGGECEETIHIMGKVDVATPGFHHLAGHSSADLIDELCLMSPLKTKRVRNMNKCCAVQENVNKNLNFERTPKTANRNVSMELNGPDTLIPLSDYAFPSEIPNNLRHLEIDHSRSQEVSPQPVSVKKRTHLSTCGSSCVKRKRSALSCNKSNLERFSIQHKLQEDIEKQTLDDDHSLSRVETSRKKTKQVLAAYLKQENSTRTGKPPKYMSLNCIGNTFSNIKTTLPKKSRPIVCGNSGIIYCGETDGDQKPPKIISLSLILKNARRCSTVEVYHTSLGLDNELSSLKLLHEEDMPSSFSENGQNPKILHVSGKSKGYSSKNGGYLDTLSAGNETDSVLGPGLHPKQLKSQSTPKQEDVRTQHLNKFGTKHRHATKNCLLASGINECSKSIEAENELNDFPSTTVDGVEHQNEKLHPREILESALPTNVASFAKLKNSQDHAGKLSQVSRRRCSQGYKFPPFLLNSDSFCCVCGSSNQEDANHLIECNDCLIKVHQACYGVSKIPKGHWSCRPCKANSQNIVCVLCGYGGGAMTRALKCQNIVKSLLKAWKVSKTSHSGKSVPSESTENEFFNPSSVGEVPKFKCGLAPLGEIISDFSPKAALKLDMQMQTNFTESKNCMPEKFQTHNSITAGVLDPSTKQWVHMVCGLWTPGTRCPNVDTMSTFDVSGALPAKKNIVCSICNRPGGSCIECRVPTCCIPFHPWCAQQKGLLQSEIEGDDNERVGFYGRCPHHATLNSCLPDSHVMDPEEESPRNNDWTCARTEGFKGRKREKGYKPNTRRPCDNAVCIVSQEQINAWLHINGQKSCTRGVVRPPCSDVEYDLRKEYIRYKQSKGWKHLVVYKSGIHALGLYTSQFIARGAMVVEYVGEIVGLRVADKREAEYQSGRRIQYKSACYFFRIDKEHIIDATRKGGIARFVNHSCLPNCVAKVISIRNEKKVVFFAERDINPGEEITYDYHFNSEDEGKKIPCFCNSRNCRRYLN